MKICRLLRGCAVLALVACLVAPRASAGSITFGPLQSPTYLDITFDATGGGVVFSGWRDGWGAGADTEIGWDYGNFQIRTPLEPRLDYFWHVQGYIPFGGVPTIGFWFGRVIFRLDWAGPLPTAERVSPMSYHITWDLTEFVSPVPDSGSTLALLGGALGLLLAFHRRREIPRPRAMSGV